MSKKSRARAAGKEIGKVATPALPQPVQAPVRGWQFFLAMGTIVLSGLAAYYNIFSLPFVFDDKPGIQDNRSIRHLWESWNPPHGAHYGGLPVAGRPLANISLAFNYAIGGLNVAGYHALNLAIHISAGLTLFGVVRRTLLQPTWRGRYGDAARWLALAVAGLWVLHPLQTESVTYTVQRAESLMGLFYLLTLYCFIRAVEDAPQTSSFVPPGGTAADKPNVERRTSNAEQTTNHELPTTKYAQPSVFSFQSSVLWQAASLAACLLGMASKEVMVSAPLMVLLYDRTFASGTFREALKKRRPYYAGLAATWILLGYLVASTSGRGGTAGFGNNVTLARPYEGLGSNITWRPYALTQFHAIVRYLRLALWPAGQVFDYGTSVITRPEEAAPYAAVVLLLLAGALFLLWRRPKIGFAAIWFFAILAPSSSVVPVVTQTAAEHRMYLALAPVIALAVLGLYSLLGRRSGLVFLVLAAGLGFTTARRNEIYRSPLALWTDTVEKCPDNARAHYSVGNVLRTMGKTAGAIAEFQKALAIAPNYAQAHDSLANLLEQSPAHYADAIAEYREALRLNPGYSDAHYNLALALSDVPDQMPEAILEFQAALRIKPDFVEARISLGKIYLKFPDRLREAISELEAAIKSDPNIAEAHYFLGMALSRAPERPEEAVSEFESALRLKPDLDDAQCPLGFALARVGRFNAAIPHLQEAVRVQPDNAEAHDALGFALIQTGQYSEAADTLRQALKTRPNNPEVHDNLGLALLRAGKLAEAADQFNETLKLDANFVTARLNLAAVLAQAHRASEAKQQLEVVIQAKADDDTVAAAQKMLAELEATPGSPASKK